MVILSKVRAIFSYVVRQMDKNETITRANVGANKKQYHVKTDRLKRRCTECAIERVALISLCQSDRFSSSKGNFTESKRVHTARESSIMGLH
jgi:hypothetical protein